MEAPGQPGLDGRLDAEAGLALARLERGFRLLDTIAQLAPLLGLFGTVLGMIEAFQSLQEAGSSVDPSLLAGGIWVALLTTAVGLAVAMPTSMILTWLESRTARERVFADKALRTVLVPGLAVPEAAGTKTTNATPTHA
jgi:biopolymer transport protein ExbB